MSTRRRCTLLLATMLGIAAGVFLLTGCDTPFSVCQALFDPVAGQLLPVGVLNGMLSPLGIASVALLSLALLAPRWLLKRQSAPSASDMRLAELSDRLAGAHGIESVLGEAREFFAAVFAPLETLVFLEQPGGRLWLHSTNPDKRRELKLPQPIMEKLRRGEALARAEAEGDGGGSHFWREFGVELLLPLRGSPPFGVLALGARASNKVYSAPDLRFLQTACNQLALGLTKATLFEHMEEDASISAALIRAQNEIAFSLNAPDILDRLCQVTATALDLECSHTLMWEPEGDLFVALAGYGDSPEQAQELGLVRVPADVLGDLPERFKSEDAIQCWGYRYRPLVEPLGYAQASAIIMPLRREGELIGLHLAGCRSRRPHFTSRHDRIARGIAHAGSMALANAYLMEELASASRVKSDFVASMSHELRTPLNHIIGYNDLMLDGAFGEISEEQRDTLQRVRRSSHNLLDLIEATLNLSRLDANKVAVDLRDVNIPFLAAELADRLEHSCKKPGVEVEWKVRHGVETLRTDPIKLQMILKNLVENAVKFTSRGRVVVTVRLQGGGVEFEVSDSGAGIPKHLQAAIFEPFRRVHDPNASPGVGLGLHIVRRLVDLMQGTITVASEVDLGSCFRVWLPSAPAPVVDKEGDGDAPRASTVPLSPTVH